MYKFVMENRVNTRPVNSKDFPAINTQFLENWKNAVENLRLAASAFVTESYNGKTADEQTVGAVFEAWKKCRAFFTNKSAGLKLPGEKEDFTVITAIVNECRKPGKDGQKEFLPCGKIKFRKQIEIFCADRMKNHLAKTAEQIEAERAAKRKARAAARKNAKKKSK